MSDSFENPYASPKSKADADAVIPRWARVSFQGTVKREVLRNGLKSRVSWSGMGTFLIVSLICFGASGDSIGASWSPIRVRSAADPMSELVGIAGLGFLALSAWHVLLCCTTWNVDRRERAIRKYSPHLYDQSVGGYADQDHLCLDKPSGQIWLSWEALGLCQFTDDLLLLHWNKGVLGTTVLTRDMFPSLGEYQAVCQICQARMNRPNRDPTSVGKRYLETEETQLREPRGELVGTVQQGGTLKTLVWTAVFGIPIAVFRSSRPLHVFFGGLVILTLLLAYHKREVALTLFAIWGGILVVGSVLSVLQNRQFFSARGPSLSSRCVFYTQELHVQTAFAYFIMPIDRFVLLRTDQQRMRLQQKGFDHSWELRKSEFSSDQDFQRVQTLLEDVMLT